MKIYKKLMFAFAIGLLTFSSCQKEELEDTNYPNPNPPNNDLGRLDCFVSTGYWESTTYSASFVNDVVKLQVINKDKDTMIFNVVIEDGISYYKLNNNNNNFVYFKDSEDESDYYLTSLAPVSEGDIGHVKILIDTVNHLMSGSFAYKAYKSTDISVFKTVTEGSFSNIKYNYQEDLSQNTMSAIVFNDTINAFNPVYASKNYSNYFEIRGLFNTNEYIGLYFNGNNLTQGDSIPLDNNNFGYHYNGNTSFNSTDGFIKITQYNDSTKTLKGSFEFYFGTDSVKNGLFNVVYFEQ